LPAGSSRKKLVLFGVAGSILVAIVIYFVFSRRSWRLDDDLRYMPEDCRFVMSIDVDAVRTSQLGREFLASDAYKQFNQGQAERNHGADFEQNFEEEVGVKIDELSRVTFFEHSGDGPDRFCGVIRVANADKFARTQRDGAKRRKVETEDETIGRYTLKKIEHDVAFCIIDSSTVLVGPVHILKPVLRRDKKPDIPAGLQAAIAEADFSQPIAVAFNLANLGGEERKQFNRDMREIDREVPDLTNRLTGAAGTIRFGSTIELSGTLLCKNSGDAAEAKELLTKLKNKMVRRADEPGVPNDIGKFLDAIQVSSSGTKCTATGRIEVRSIMNMIHEWTRHR
jgi:hypothetical protein